MYEYKVFETSSIPSSIAALNELLEYLQKGGWEPMSVDYTRYTVFARKPKILND